jgi:hypothetical protein
MRKILTAVLFSLCSFAAHAATIGFEELHAGMAPANSYSSLGATFSGGRVATNSEGNYIAGPFSVTFAQPVSDVSFYIDGLSIDSMSTVCFIGNQCEPFYTGSMSFTPNTPNKKRADWHPGMVWLDDLMFEGITSIRFETAAFDNLRYTVPGAVVAAGMESSEVPEPSTLLLFCAGFLLIAGHSQRNRKDVDQFDKRLVAHR